MASPHLQQFLSLQTRQRSSRLLRATTGQNAATIFKAHSPLHLANYKGSQGHVLQRLGLLSDIVAVELLGQVNSGWGDILPQRCSAMCHKGWGNFMPGRPKPAASMVASLLIVRFIDLLAAVGR